MTDQNPGEAVPGWSDADVEGKGLTIGNTTGAPPRSTLRPSAPVPQTEVSAANNTLMSLLQKAATSPSYPSLPLFPPPCFPQPPFPDYFFQCII